MSVPATIRAMRAAGVSDAQIIDAVLAMEEERLAKGRARQAKFRNSKRDGDVTDVTRVTSRHTKEIPPTPPKENTTPPDIPPMGDISPPAGKPTPFSELSTVLDAERARAVIDHRQRLRKPLTAHAAKLLAKRLAACPDPNAAADMMIERGWQSIKPEWLEDGNARGPPPKPENDMQAAIRRMKEDLRVSDEPDSTITAEYTVN